MTLASNSLLAAGTVTVNQCAVHSKHPADTCTACVLHVACWPAGTVSGVQASLQSAFEVLSFLVGAVIHRPQQFHWLMAGSCAAILAATALFQTYACRERALARS
jgi:hypothetical protein